MNWLSFAFGGVCGLLLATVTIIVIAYATNRK